MRYCTGITAGLDMSAIEQRYDWGFDVVDLEDGRKMLSFQIYGYPIEPGMGMSQHETFEDYIENSRPYFDGAFMRLGPWWLWDAPSGRIHVLDGPQPYEGFNLDMRDTGEPLTRKETKE